MLGIGQHAPFGVIPFAPVGGATHGSMGSVSIELGHVYAFTSDQHGTH